MNGKCDWRGRSRVAVPFLRLGCVSRGVAGVFARLTVAPSMAICGDLRKFWLECLFVDRYLCCLRVSARWRGCDHNVCSGKAHRGCHSRALRS